MIKNLKKVDNETVSFTLGPTTIAFANTIKRVYKAYIPVVAFDIDSIDIDVDTTSLRKEYIEHRISMLPIDNTKITGKVNPESIKFELDVENKSKEFEMMDVLGKHLVASDKKTYFDPQFLLLRIKPGQKLHLTAHLKLFDQRTIANRNNALVSYVYDPLKQLGGGMYNFDFTVESYDSIPVNDLMKLGKEAFVRVFQEYLKQVDDSDIFQFDPKMHKVRVKTEDPHTLGNVVTQDILVHFADSKKESIDYCGYRQPHPTEMICEIKIESDSVSDEKHTDWMKKLLKDSLERIIKTKL